MPIGMVAGKWSVSKALFLKKRVYGFTRSEIATRRRRFSKPGAAAEKTQEGRASLCRRGELQGDVFREERDDPHLQEKRRFEHRDRYCALRPDPGRAGVSGWQSPFRIRRSADR